MIEFAKQHSRKILGVLNTARIKYDPNCPPTEVQGQNILQNFVYEGQHLQLKSFKIMMGGGLIML
jgi:hypothetical protein